MGERTTAQDMAAENWRYLKSQVRYWRSWKYTPSAHPRAYAAWVADMRNAWVAYHAGAPWMTREDEVDYMVRECVSCRERYCRERNEVLRLAAEVERLREHAEHDRETLTPIENAFEAVGGDLVDEVLGLRAEIERLQKRWDQHMEAARHAEERVCHRIDNFERCGECEACLLLDSERDAQAREDGAS